MNEPPIDDGLLVGLGMDPSEVQQHKHGARMTAAGLRIFRDALLAAGLSSGLCDDLVAIRYKWLLEPDYQGQMSAVTGNMVEQMGEIHDAILRRIAADEEGDGHDEGA
jgi:hypothetical protein